MVGWVGRLTPIKRPLDLIRTLRALLDSGVDAVLVLVGDGDERTETEALAHELGSSTAAASSASSNGSASGSPPSTPRC